MSDQDLLLLLRKHPEQGIHKMMALYGGAIATICRNFLYDCSEEDVEEAIADTFIHLWKNLDKFELKENYSIKSYLYAIARNVARDLRRKRKKTDSGEKKSRGYFAYLFGRNEGTRQECIFVSLFLRVQGERYWGNASAFSKTG